MGNSLVFWSVVAIIIRIITVILLAYIARVQYHQFQFKSRLQPLKRLLFFVPIVLIITNIPQFVLSWERAHSHAASNLQTNLATISNSLAIFLVAILLVLIYNFKDGGNG